MLRVRFSTRFAGSRVRGEEDWEEVCGVGGLVRVRVLSWEVEELGEAEVVR